MHLKRRLMIAVATTMPLAVTGLTPPASAQTGSQVRAADATFPGQQQTYRLNSWTASFFLNGTNNFSRIEEGEYRRLFTLDDGSFLTRTDLVDNGDGTGTLVTSLVEDTVPIEPAAKVFTTVNLSGYSSFNRPRTRGLVRGQVRVGTYFNQENVEDRNQDTIGANLPQEAIDAGATPTIGDFDVRSAFVDPNISGIVELDVVGDAVGVEAGGFVIEQGQVQGSQLQAQQPGQDFNQVIVGGFFFSPVARASLPLDQEIEFRVRNSSVIVLDEVGDEAARAILPVQEINDSISNEAQLSYRSGSVFGGLQADLDLFVRDLTEEGSDTRGEQELEQTSGSIVLRTPVTGTLTLSATAGYDDITGRVEDSPELNPVTGEPVEEARTEDYSGFFYSLGFEYKPSRRSQVRLAIGERYQGLFVEALSSIALTPRLQWNVQANRQVGSSLQDQQDQFRFFNIAVLNIIDELRLSNDSLSSRSVGRSVDPIIQNMTADARSNFGIRRTSQFSTQLVGSYNRNTVILRGNAILVDDESQALGQQGAGRNQYGSLASFSRRLSRRLQFTAASQNLYLEGSEGDGAVSFDGIFDQFYTLQASYQINSNIALSGSFQHLRRDIQGFEQEPLSLFDGRFFEYRESQLRGGIQVLF